MQYQPGSFSRNFAWHGTGLGRLYDATRNGFDLTVRPVARELWRERSGINDRYRSLVPVNFFLANNGSLLVPDELVSRTLRENHSVQLDRLALFALHLSRVGFPPDGSAERPILWANEFVREHLYDGHGWSPTRLSKALVDSVLAKKLGCLAHTRIKCRNNYLHLFELCGYLSGSSTSIDTGAEEWLSSALFLAWDRYAISGIACNDDYLDRIEREEIFKLLGLPRRTVSESSKGIFQQYRDLGGLRRLQH